MPPNIESEIAITSVDVSRLPILSTSSVVTEKRADTVDALNVITQEKWYKEGLVIVVVGASGDLAKKKTYPSLLDLYSANLLPRDTIIWGYARSRKTHESLRSSLKPYLLSSNYDEGLIDSFLSRCFYKSGKSYGDIEAFQYLNETMCEHESNFPYKNAHNRLFYFAIPPNVFGESGVAIKRVAMAPSGWSRVVIEKPFGHDLESCNKLLSLLSSEFDEDHLYRIDHYLGKEIVQNLLTFRFGNSWLDWMWHRNAISHMVICFKENFGTDGRGGYFDQYGIIRDVIQNHLMQVLTLLAMEPPPLTEDGIRDAKVQVLQSIPPITLSDCLLGQYEGYLDDPTITNKSSNSPTFAAIRCFVNTPRWKNVPFIFIAGKAVDDKKVDVTVHFKQPNNVMFQNTSNSLPHNELVMRLQPNESIYMKTNVKSPGFNTQPTSSQLQIDYKNEFNMKKQNNPDAYTRLILDVLRGRQASFVRDDELSLSWKIFTPILHQIEKEQIKPFSYKTGQEGPEELEKFLLEKTSANNKDSDEISSMLNMMSSL